MPECGARSAGAVKTLEMLPEVTRAGIAYKSGHGSNYARIPDPNQTKEIRFEKENKDMSNTNNSSRLVVPGAREAMDKFKMEAANDLAVPTPY